MIGGNQAAVAVQRLIAESSLAGERMVSIARLVFCVVVGGRSAFYWLFTDADHRLERAWLAYPTLAVVIVFSLAVLGGGVPARRVGLVIHLSVSMDVVVTFLHLLPNSVWPGPGFLGAPFLIDTAVILVVTMAAGVRQSPSAAALGGALSGLSLVGLAIADLAVGRATAVDLWRGYTMYAVLVAAVTALSLLIALRNRRLVESAASAALSADAAARGLRSVLRDHHDLRTVISSAQINADLLSRGVPRGGDEDRASTVAHLLEDLGELRRQLEYIKGRTVDELAVLEDRLPTEVARSIADVIAALGPRFPRVALEASVEASRPALVSGGGAGLRHILANLIVNACEGDGVRGASRVEVRAREEDARILIELVDDGPGLPAQVLAATPGQAASTKPAGAGLGIGLTAVRVKASRGQVSWSNRDEGGARIVVELPVAPDLPDLTAG